MLRAGSRRTGPRPSEGLVAAARKRTTTLAANLLELAARGEADERLLEAADHVVAGSPCGLAFLDWGAHSGTDFLVGLALEARMPEGWEQVYTFDPDRRPQGP